MLAFNEVALVRDPFSLYVKCSKSKSSDELFHKVCLSKKRKKTKFEEDKKEKKKRKKKGKDCFLE